MWVARLHANPGMDVRARVATHDAALALSSLHVGPTVFAMLAAAIAGAFATDVTLPSAR